MGKSVTPTVEGGLLVAITIILGLITVYVPILGMFAEFFCAVPVAVLTARQGAGKGLTALVVTFILLSMLISPVLSLRLTLSSGTCGVALGWCVRKNFDAIRIFLFTLITASAAQVLSIALLLFVMDINVIEMQLDVLRESFSESFQMYESMGVDKERIAATQEQVEPMLEFLALLIPTLITISALVTATAIWLAAHWIFPKLQIKIPTLPPFAQWKFPAAFFYTALIGGLGLYWGLTRGWTNIQEISINLLIISGLIGFVQGLSLMSFIFDRYKISKLVRRFIYVILILNMLLVQLVAITGLIDMLFDYRKRLFDGK